MINQILSRPAYKGKILASDQTHFYLINGNVLSKFLHSGEELIKSKIDICFFDYTNLYPYIISRALRRGVLGGCVGVKTLLIWTRKEIFIVDKSDLKILKKEKFNDKRYILNPCIVNNDGVDTYYFGDYFSNPEKKSCYIWSFSMSGLKIEHQFDEGLINHIHSIITRSPYSLIIFTGDFGNASSIWEFNLSNKSISLLLCGLQKYRSCVGFVSNDFLFYASDTTSESNAFYKINLLTMEHTELYKLPASVIYGDFDKESGILCFSTNLEAALETRSSWNKWLSRKLPACFETDKVVVYSFANGSISCIHSEEPSLLPYRLFQYPTFMTRVGGGFAYISGCSTLRSHNITMQIPLT